MQEDIGKAKRNGNIVTTYPVDLGKYCWQEGNISAFLTHISRQIKREIVCQSADYTPMSVGWSSELFRTLKGSDDFVAIPATVMAICKDVIQPGVIIETPIWFYIRFYAEQHGIPRPRLYLRQRGFCPL